MSDLSELYDYAGYKDMQIDNITLPNITNYEEFKGKMFKDMQHDIRFEKMVQSMTLPSLHGQRSRLAKHSIKF